MEEHNQTLENIDLFYMIKSAYTSILDSDIQNYTVINSSDTRPCGLVPLPPYLQLQQIYTTRIPAFKIKSVKVSDTMPDK